MNIENTVRVVKLGGSLLELPDLIDRFDRLLDAWGDERLVLVVGGGTVADWVRQFDAANDIGPTQAHWLAVRAMQLNSHLIASKLPRCRMVVDHEACQTAWREHSIPLVEPLGWLEAEHTRGIAIPHRWSFTSDSVAAHIAQRLGAVRLTLLKSTVPNTCSDPLQAATDGIVDKDFPTASEGIAAIDLINLRSDPPHQCRLRTNAHGQHR